MLDKIHKAWDELDKINLVQVVKEVISEKDLIELVFTGEDAWDMMGFFHPEYIYVSGYKIKDVSTESERKVEGIVTVLGPKLDEDTSEQLIERLINFYQEVHEKYSEVDNYDVWRKIGNIYDRVRYVCLRLGNGFYREDVRNGFIVGPVRHDKKFCGTLVFCYEEAKMLGDNNTPEDYFEKSDSAALLEDMGDLKECPGLAKAREEIGCPIGLSIEAIEKIMDGKYELTNCPTMHHLLAGMGVQFIKARGHGGNHYPPAILIGYNNELGVDFGRDKTADHYDVTVL